MKTAEVFLKEKDIKTFGAIICDGQQLIELLELYHQSKLSEVTELPDSNSVPHHSQYDSNEAGAEWMRCHAVKLLLKKDGENNQMRFELTQALDSVSLIESQLKQKDKEIAHLRESETSKVNNLVALTKEIVDLKAHQQSEHNRYFEQLEKSASTISELTKQEWELRKEPSSLRETNAGLENKIQELNEEYKTAVKQKINYSKEVDRLREKYEPKGITNEHKGA